MLGRDLPTTGAKRPIAWRGDAGRACAQGARSATGAHKNNWRCRSGQELRTPPSLVPSTPAARLESSTGTRSRSMQRSAQESTSGTKRPLHCKFETNIPRKELRGTVPFPHSCVWERFIYFHDRPAFSAAGNMWTDSGNTVYKLLTDTWMWKLDLTPHNFQKRNT